MKNPLEDDSRWTVLGDSAPGQPCMVCDLYAVIDRQGDTGSDFVAELVSVLPPRGHAFHKLGIWERTYRTPDFLRAAAGLGGQ